MARYLLDTDAIVDYLAGFPSTVSLVRKLHERGESLCVCDVVIAEVYAGLLPKDRDKGRRLLSSCLFLPTTPESAQQAGEWRHAYARRGVVLSTTDALVAATAQDHQATLVTANKDHYPMESVSVMLLPRPD